MRAEQELEGHSVLRFMDPWLPPGIRTNTSLSLEGLIRSRVLVCILLFSIFITAFSLILCAVFQLATEHDFAKPIIISAVCCIMVGLNYLYFYRSAKLDASGIMYSLLFFLVVVVAVVLTGGYLSPVKQILLCCPVMSFLISGRYEGFYNAALVFVFGVALLILDSIGFNLIQILPAAIIPFISGITWFVTVMLTIMCLYIYDLLLEDMRRIRANI